MKRSIALLITIIMVISLLAGCNGSTKDNETASTNTEKSTPASSSINETGTLNLDWISSVGTDTVFECPWAGQQCLYTSIVFDSLVKKDVYGTTIIPSLAKSWEISPDGKTYTFTINDNIKWHDGKEFSAEDIVFSFNTSQLVPQSTYKTSFSKIVGAKDVKDGKAKTMTGVTVDGKKVIIKLTSPDGNFLTALSGFRILPQHLLKDADPTLFIKNEKFWKKPIGTGLYKIDEVSFPNFFTAVRNEDYFNKKPKIKTILFTSHVTGGGESQIADIIAGKMDYAFGSTVNDINTAKNIVNKNLDIKMMMMASSYSRQFWFNNVGSSDNKYNTDMQKLEVRQAINLLLDKVAIASFYMGQAVPLSTYVNPKSSEYNSDIPLFKRDVAKAKQMLTAAKFDFSRPIRILYYYNDQTTVDIMELIKQNFAEAGVQAETILATGDLASIIYKVKNWDMMYAAAGNPDSIITYEHLVPGNQNMDGLFGDIENRQAIFTPLLSKYNETADLAGKKKLGDQIQFEANKYCMTIPVYALNKINLYNSKKLKVPEDIFTTEFSNPMIHEWELLK